jgi:pimeloyl-ACP methyl ester carboxylesterase
MTRRPMRFSLITLLFPLMLLNMGCGYIVKNERHQVYSKPRYGQDRFVVINHYNIHYVEIKTDKDQSETILLIPGAFSTYRDWNRMIPILSKHYRLLALDYLGVGDSDKPRSGFNYTIEEQANLIAGMIEKLQIPKVHVVGVSYGGMIALNLATRYPDRVGKVVCIEGAVIKPRKLPHQLKKGVLRWPLVGDFFVSAARSGLFDTFTARSVLGDAWGKMSQNDQREVFEIIGQNNKMASRVSWYRISRTFENSKDFAEEIKTMRAPVLYLYGKSSEYRQMAIINVEFFKVHLPEVKIVGIEDGIHDLQLQKPKEVTKLILDFVGRNGNIVKN